MRILILDDDENRARSLGMYIAKFTELASSFVDIADCVADARENLRATYYDALVIDVMLPWRRSEGCSHQNSVSLLSELSRNRGLRKPEKIIAITAFEDEIHQFRREFDRLCTVVVPAASPSDEWRKNICEALTYTAASQLSRVAAQGAVNVFTVHGIRTYGEWQNRWRRLVETRVEGVAFFDYKYGYFSVLALMIPYFRRREVRRLSARALDVLGRVQGGRIYIFAHSFGTYLVAEAIRTIQAPLHHVDLTLVLCGSVLDENYDWGFVSQSSRIRVVNDCGRSDTVLCLGKALVPGLGMAGRVGLNGFNGDRLVNRWFRGGHSHYFDGDAHMRSFWLPILSGTDVASFDERARPNPISLAVEGAARLVSAIKLGLYGLIFCSAAYVILNVILN